MPSSNKTPFSKLNQWVGSDMPKRDDWNTDNLRIDRELERQNQETIVHNQGSGHITHYERERWNQARSAQRMFYIGNGEAIRTFNTAENVTFGVLFAIAKPPIAPGSVTNFYSGFLSSNGCSEGINLKEKGFIVHNQQAISPSGYRSRLNELNQPYLICYWTS